MQAELRLVEHEEDGIDVAFRTDVLRGLAERQRAVPARWLYDLEGSRLFEDITKLPECYPTCAETRILAANGGSAAIAAVLTRAESGSAATHLDRRVILSPVVVVRPIQRERQPMTMMTRFSFDDEATIANGEQLCAQRPIFEKSIL